MQNWQDGVGLGQPFQHGMAQHQVVGLGQLSQQLLPGRLDECCLLTGFVETLAGAFEHGLGRLGQGHLMTAFGQPQRHMAQPRADIQHAQGAIRQRLGKVRLEHGQANGALGAAVDFFGETGRQFIEVTIVHRAKRLSLSASLLRTTCSISRPSSLHSNSR
ncbi:hypothetical protein D3C76_1277710 [compost metagenome]